ncbi:MAG: DUF2177 family protein [Parachlamydia sp.]|nr:DUF2177 family protein [Parachlamydia sp.]
MQFVLSFIFSLLAVLCLDALWLGLMLKRFYVPQMGHLLSESMRIGPAIAFYLLYAFSLCHFVVLPELKQPSSYFHVLLQGALLGLFAYGTYDLTNQVTLKHWPLTVTLVDMVWGASLSAMVSGIAVIFTRYVTNRL